MEACTTDHDLDSAIRVVVMQAGAGAGDGDGDGDEKPLAARARALRLSVMTTWQVSPSDEARNAKREATAMRSRLLRVGRGIGLLPDGVEVSGICREAAKGEAAGFASGLAEAQATSRSR